MVCLVFLLLFYFLCPVTRWVLHGFVVCNKIIGGALTAPLPEEGIELITVELGAVTAVGSKIIIVGYEEPILYDITLNMNIIIIVNLVVII